MIKSQVAPGGSVSLDSFVFALDVGELPLMCIFLIQLGYINFRDDTLDNLRLGRLIWDWLFVWIQIDPALGGAGE
jgi:hypothetical protein